MKSLLTRLSLFGVFLGVFILSVFPARHVLAAPGGWQTLKFLPGQILLISNNQTLTVTSTNVFYIDNNNIGRWSFQQTNFIPTTGQSGTNFIPPAFYYTNAATYSSTNALAGGYASNAFTLNGAPFNDVDGFVDANADVGFGVLSVTVLGVGSVPATVATAPTNTMTVTFYKSAAGTANFATDGILNYDYMQMAFTCPAGSNAVFMTNVNSTFFQGARKLRVTVATSNVSSGTNNIIGDISLNGWIP